MDTFGTAAITFLHLLVFAYWLGGDLGVFYLSRTVTDERASIEQRQFAVSKLLSLDLVPRFALLLTLPTGLTTAVVVGWLAMPLWSLALVWIAAIGWMALVLKLHHGPSANWAHIDTGLRMVFIMGLLAAAALAQLPTFIRLKLALLATAVILGLIVRVCLKPLGPGLAALANGDTDSANPLINASIGRSRLPVMGIWVVIAIAAFMGLWRPL